MFICYYIFAMYNVYVFGFDLFFYVSLHFIHKYVRVAYSFYRNVAMVTLLIKFVCVEIIRVLFY
jgi:hypothetical protein